MAHTADLSTASLASVARQIAERPSFSLAAPGALATPRSIAESFPIWMLGADALQTSGKRLRDIAKDIGTWHHQINQQERASEVARSVPSPNSPGELKLVEFGTSPLAAKIGETIGWIDKNASGDPMVRLLSIPAYYVMTFWLEQPDTDQIVIVDRPSAFEAVRYQVAYEYESFRMLLRDMRRPQGIPPGPLPEPPKPQAG